MYKLHQKQAKKADAVRCVDLSVRKATCAADSDASLSGFISIYIAA